MIVKVLHDGFVREDCVICVIAVELLRILPPASPTHLRTIPNRTEITKDADLPAYRRAVPLAPAGSPPHLPPLHSTHPMPQDDPPPPDLAAALVRMGLLAPAAPPPEGARLTGGVSSDIWRIDLSDRPDLRQARAGEAARRRRLARAGRAQPLRGRLDAPRQRRRPGAAPALLGQDDAIGRAGDGVSLPPTDHPLWKDQLRDGHADPAFAAQVGATLAAIHAATAADPAIAADFPTDEIFYDIRLEPYLLATARAHPDRAEALTALVATTAANKRALVHGDVSPKNILCRPRRPGVPRRRMRLVGRSGLRSRLLPQSPAAEMPLDAARARRLPGVLRRARRRLSRRHRLGTGRRAGGPRRASAARPCCWRGWMASRRSNTSPTERDKDRSAASPARLLADPPRPPRRSSAQGPGKQGTRRMTDTEHRLRPRPPRLGQPRPPDRGGRRPAGRRRGRPRPSPRPAPPPARARRSICATAARRSAATT